MCGRYTNTAGPEELNDRFRVPIPSEAGTRRFNVAPTEEVLAIVATEGDRSEHGGTAAEGGGQARLLRWGLIPSWAREAKGQPLMINARMETVASRPAFRRLIPKASRRALQLADGYYEWLKPEKRSDRSKIGQRQPFFFQVDGGIPFAFAAIWTPAKVDGEWVASVALLTCDSAPNPVAAAIHDRMPVILADRDAQQAWLDPALGAEDALALCGPLSVARLSAQPANPAVNGVIGVDEGPHLLRAPS